MEIPAVNWLFTSDPRSALYNLSVGSVTPRDVIMKNGPLSVESVDIMHWMFVLYVQSVLICVMHWVCCTCPDLCHALVVCVVRVPICFVHWVCWQTCRQTVETGGDTDQPSVLLSSALLHTAVQRYKCISFVTPSGRLARAGPYTDVCCGPSRPIHWRLLRIVSPLMPLTLSFLIFFIVTLSRLSVFCTVGEKASVLCTVGLNVCVFFAEQSV